MIGEDKIKERIKELESMLDANEERFHSLNSADYYEDQSRRKILLHCYGIESQLKALYYVLGEQYFSRYK